MTSIEFRPVGSFTSPLFSVQKSTRRAVRDGVVTSSAALVVPEKHVLFVGLTDGKILCWETDQTIAERSTENRARTLDGHKGAVRCIIFSQELCEGIMFTGSADRSIKMWDLSDPRISIPCVCNLFGHGGTVLAMEYGSEQLISSSTDGFMCVWRDQSPVKLVRFPAFSVRQKIVPDAKAASMGSRVPKEVWFLSLAIRTGEALSVFAGDSEGYVHVYKPEAMEDDSGDLPDLLLVWKAKVHDLGISKIKTVPTDSIMFTLSFDQSFKALDSLSGQIIFEESNQCGVVFNSAAWDPSGQDLIVVDDRGNVGFYNLYTESCVVWKSLTRDQVTQVLYEPAPRRLLLLSPHALRVFEVVRGVRYSEITEHTGPIVAMASRSAAQEGLLYTAAMDNMIKLWDTDSLECIKSLKEKKHEITAMVYLPQANVIVTGHENSDLKMWSVDCQQEASLRTVSGQAVHSNTISTLDWAAWGSSDLSASRPTSLAQDMAHGAAETIVAGSYDRRLSFWKISQTSDGTAMAKFERAFCAHQGIDDEVLVVCCNATTGSVFSGGNGGVVRKWPGRGGELAEATYEGHEDAVTCLTAQGAYLFSGSADCTVRVWDALRAEELKVVRVHTVTVQALLAVPNSHLLVSCGFDGRAVFWDPQMDVRLGVREMKTYEQPEEFRSLAYMDMTHSVLVGCESGKIIAFPVPVDDATVLAGSEISKMHSQPTTRPSSRGGEPLGTTLISSNTEGACVQEDAVQAATST